jgi:hypothetical protein
MFAGTSVKHIYVIGDAVREPDRIAYLQSYFKDETIETFCTYMQPTWKTTLADHVVALYCPRNQSKQGRPLKLAELSIFLNFMAVFETILQTYSDGYFIIFESDVRFEGSIRPYLVGLESFLHYIQPDAASIGSGCDLIDSQVNTDDMNFQIYKKQIVRCMDSYVFSYKGIQSFMHYIENYLKTSDNKSIDEPIDNFFQTFIEKGTFEHYWVWPSLTLQGSQNGQYASFIQTDASDGLHTPKSDQYEA